MATLVQNDSETSPVNFDSAIGECVKRILQRYGGNSSCLFLYNFRTKKMFRGNEIASKPEDLEDCLDHMFDGASVIIKKAIMDEVTERFGLEHSCESLKEAFEQARKSGQTMTADPAT